MLAALLAAAGLAQTLNVDIPFQKFVLDNGLTVIVTEDHKAPIVAVNIWYHVGSKNEKPGKTGFAHLFEHLMFGGSENVKGRYIETMEKVGATSLNGTTNEDRTNYFENVPTSALDFALFAESDRMGHLLKTFDKKTLDLQRGVVQNEKRQGENQPYAVADQLIIDATYPAKHPYSWSVIGSMDDLNAASLEDVSEWFRTYYGPSNAVLSLAGDIDLATAKAKAAKYFGDLPPGPPVAHHEAWVAKMTGSHRQRVEDRVPQARLYRVWNVPQYGSADASYLGLVRDCLAQGKSSRLYKRLVYDDQIATELFAYVDTREIGSQFAILATARQGVPVAKLETAIQEELTRFIAGGPTAQELETVKIQRLSNFVRGLQRVGGFGGKSDVLAQAQVYLGDAAAYKTVLKQMSDATTADLQSAAKRWLSDGDFVLDVEPFPSYKESTSGVDRSKMPEMGAPPVGKFPKLKRTTLSNGLKVVLAERHELPLVNLTLMLDAGFAADQFAVPGAANLTMSLLTSGTKTRNALQISDELLALGATANGGSGLDTSSLEMSAIKPKLDASLALFGDLILNPSFPEEDLQREKKLTLANIEQEKVEPFSMALRVFPELLYGKGHPYSSPLTGSGTVESVTKITRADLVRFQQTWFHPNAATLVVVGDTTLAEMTPKLEKQFAGWKAAAVPVKNLAKVALPAKPVVYLMDRPGAQQTMIMAGQVAPPKNNPQELPIALLNDTIGGTFGSRLNMNLREDKHWSYGSFSTVIGAKGQSPMVALAPVQTDKTKESLAEMSRELSEMASTHPVTAAELDKNRNNRILGLPGSKETVGSVDNSIQTIVAYGFPDDYYDTYVDRLKAVSPGDMVDVAKSVLHPDSLVWVVVGDRAKIEAGVRALNIGEVRVIDADGKPVASVR
jgi:zinc protease